MKHNHFIMYILIFLMTMTIPFGGMAQEKGRISYQYGTGIKSTIVNSYRYEIPLVLGVGYKISDCDKAGLSLQTDIWTTLSAEKSIQPQWRTDGILLPSLYAYLLHDFRTKNRTGFYTEYQVGLSGLISHGAMIGLEPGVRFSISGGNTLRLGISLQARNILYTDTEDNSSTGIEYSAGITARLDL